MTALPTFIPPPQAVNDEQCAAFFASELEKLAPFDLSKKIAERILDGGDDSFKDMLRTNKIPFEYDHRTDAYNIGIFLPLSDETDENGFLIGRGAAKVPFGIIIPTSKI